MRRFGIGLIFERTHSKVEKQLKYPGTSATNSPVSVQTILKMAVSYLSEPGVDNFTPIVSEIFVQTTPNGVDSVFSIIMMQYLTRDLARNYFIELGRKLAPGGGLLLSFSMLKGSIAMFLTHLFEAAASRLPLGPPGSLLNYHAPHRKEVS
jgi:hypothetical protein